MSELAEGGLTSDRNFPLCFAVTCSGRVAPRAEAFGCLLVSRSPFDAVLLTGELTLAIENPRAVS